MDFNTESVLTILEALTDQFKTLARHEMHLQEDPNLNKTFHEGKEKAYYVAMDVIDDAKRLVKDA